MRLTIEYDSTAPVEIEPLVHQAFGNLAKLNVISLGKKSNLSGDQTSYISLVVTFGAGVTTGEVLSLLGKGWGAPSPDWQSTRTGIGPAAAKGAPRWREYRHPDQLRGAGAFLGFFAQRVRL